MEKAVGLTAEYNPFHLGHAYHLNEIRRICPDAPVIATLSASFTQRGMPALLDKWTRAKMAILCGGVDIVFELPEPFCCHNAGVFADASVALLKACGCVSALSFGMEDDAEQLRRISYILVQETSAFKAHLQKFLKKGLSYAEARAESAETLCPGARSLLKKPNNTLAVAYAESVLRQNAGFELLPVRRVGAAYRDETAAVPIMSAAGIRAALTAKKIPLACSAMPPAAAVILREQIESGRAFTEDTPLWQALRLLLLRAAPESLRECAGMNEGIENRLLESVADCASHAQFVEAVSTRRYPRSRVQRLLSWLLLGLSADDETVFAAHGPAYLRPLAMSVRGRRLLRDIQSRASLPVMSRPADIKGDTGALNIFRLGLRAAAIRESFLPRPDWKRDLTAIPFIGS